MNAPAASTTPASAQGAPGDLIPAMPTRVPLRLGRRVDVSALPFDYRPRMATYSGRVAIYQGLKALGLGEGSAVLVPAYACGSEIDAVLKAGCDLVFYPIRPDLTPDLEACRALVDKTPAIRAFFITHYFGFAQPLAELKSFAEDRGLALIEDCAHGFLSKDETGTPLGRTGDIAIFSFMKTLPLTDGGACVANCPGLDLDRGGLQKPNAGKLVGRFLFQVEQSLNRSSPGAAKAFRLGVRGPVRLLKAGLSLRKAGRSAAKPVAPAEAPAPGGAEEMEIIELDMKRRNWAMSGIAAGTLARLDLDPIPGVRRRNYERLLAQIANLPGIRPLFRELPEGTCPLFLPIESLAVPAAELQRRLAKAGLGTKYFWSYFHEAFPREAFEFETRLKTSVLVLPVHQDLGETDMDRAAAILTSVMSELTMS